MAWRMPTGASSTAFRATTTAMSRRYGRPAWKKSGFKIEKWWHYFSPQSLHILEWGHYFGLPSWITHALFKRWILAQTPWNLALTRKIVEPAYNEAWEQPQGSYTFYVVRKQPL